MEIKEILKKFKIVESVETLKENSAETTQTENDAE